MYLNLQTAPDTIVKYVDCAQKNNLNIEIADFHHPELLNNSKAFSIHKRFVKKTLKNFKGKISMHGPFYNMDFTSPDILIQNVVKKQFKKVFDFAHSINAENVVIHSTFNPNIGHESYIKLFIENSVLFLSSFAKSTKYKGNILIENIWDETPDYIIEIIDRLENENIKNVKFITDIGHINIFSKISAAEWIFKVRNHCSYFHFSNNFGKIDEHNDLFNGTVNFESVVKTIMDNIKNPVITLEIKTDFSYIEESIEYIQGLVKQYKT
ncbi:MAG: sugar phosphate isomerase/epimerase [Candidatus Muiribacteriota bacterium]|jgi:sugar phosphate isomerase/epimerase